MINQREDDRPLPAIRHNWFAIAAVIWSVLFALVSTYWGLGGRIGFDQLAISIQNEVLAGDTSFLLTNWVGVLAKCVWALIAWSMFRNVRRWRRTIIVLGWITGIVLTLYGGAGTIEKALMQFDIRAVASSIGEDALIWYLLLWDPWWLLGGLIFLIATRRFQQDRSQCMPTSSKRRV